MSYSRLVTLRMLATISIVTLVIGCGLWLTTMMTQ